MGASFSPAWPACDCRCSAVRLTALLAHWGSDIRPVRRCLQVGQRGVHDADMLMTLDVRVRESGWCPVPVVRILGIAIGDHSGHMQTFALMMGPGGGPTSRVRTCRAL